MADIKHGKVVIAGGGIGGLTLALALLRQGYEVEVYEQAKQLSEVGAGLQLSANANRALFALGLRDGLHAVGSQPSGKRLRLWNTGEHWDYFDLGAVSEEKYGAPYFTIYRPDLLGLLADAVEARKAGTIRLGKKISAVRQDGASAEIAFEDGTRAAGDIVVGADGVHSVVRNQLWGDGDPIYSGNMAWRGVIQMDRLPSHLQQPIGVVWVGSGAHIVHYPLRQGQLLNFVGVVERSEWVGESWSQQGTREELHQDYANWHADVHALIDHIDIPFKWSLRGRQPLGQWSNGRITLLGDACHPTLPFLAQGAVMAIEDAYVLARALGKYADVEQALRAYDAARVERGNRLVSKSSENGKRFHSDELLNPQTAKGYIDREWSEESVSQRYDWLYGYDVELTAV